MPAEIVPGEFCASYWGTYTVPGSKPGTSYAVTLGGGEGPAHCTCKAWQFAPMEEKNCKHIEWVWKRACLWNCQWHEGNDPVEIRPESVHYDAYTGNTCRNCGGPLVAVRIAV